MPIRIIGFIAEVYRGFGSKQKDHPKEKGPLSAGLGKNAVINFFYMQRARGGLGAFKGEFAPGGGTEISLTSDAEITS
jgi:hypothetical protein